MGVIASMKLSLISPTASIASRPSYHPASFGFFIGTPVASDFFRLTGNPDVGAAKVFTRLSAHAVYAGIAPFEAIFVAAPILLYPIGCHLARCQFSRSGFECDQHN